MNSPVSPTFASGTVTFLFTDIEGSTQLLQQLDDEYATLLADQRRILRATFEKNNGQEVDTQGDSFFVSFARASDGVAAAVEAQRALAAHKWPGGKPLKVRMGLHTGEPSLVEEGYVGLDVHRAARLAHAGHGGQVLLSPTTAALLARDLPAGVSLRELGEHRLKDLRQPIQIYQLDISGLPATFPSLKSLNILPNNLPSQLTSFVGRDDELVAVKDLLRQARLVTLTGPGGTGKTRLSLQVAAELVDEFQNGVWFVELEKVESSEYIVSAIARTLKFAIDTHSSDLDPKQQLLDYLSQRTLLMVLDNFEHLVEGADLLTDILSVSHAAKLIVTSRERLNLREEWAYPLSGMLYPQNGNGAGIEAYSGLALFIERSRQVAPGFMLIGDDLNAAIRICQLVDGMPLGIELAAAWVSILSCQEIVTEIERNIDFLATTMRDMPAKHRSLRAVFDQSWQHLTPEQQAAFGRLAVFQGGFRLEAARAVTGVTISTLSEFTQKSLMRRDEQGRFEMHALLKAYAEEKLNEVPEELAAMCHNHSKYYVQFLVDLQDHMQGECMLEFREKVRIEIGNVQSAIDWAMINWEEEQARKVVFASGIYAQTEGFHFAMEFYRRLEQRLYAQGAGIEPGAPRRRLLLTVLVGQAINGTTIDVPGVEEQLQGYLPALRELDNMTYELGAALLCLGILRVYRSEYSNAIPILQESLALLKDLQDHFITVACLTWLGWAYYEMGEYDQAGEHFQDSFRLCKEKENIIGLPYALSKLGTWADALQAYDKGLNYHREALKYFEAIGDQAGQGYALSRMSFSAWGLQGYEKALELGQAGYDQFHSIGHRWGTASSLCRIGFAELALDHQEVARTRFYQGLERGLEYKYPSIVNYALIGLSSLWAAEGKLDRAVEGMTLALEQESTPVLYGKIARRVLADLEAQLPAEVFSESQRKARTSDYKNQLAEILNENTLKGSPSSAADLLQGIN